MSAEKSGETVVVKAVGDNTTDAAYTATLVAKVNGETLASVDLKQAAPASGDGYALILSLADLTAGEYYMAGMIESYDDITYAPYSYHLWVGTVSGSNPAKSNSDLETVNYQYESNQLTLNPNLSDRDKEKGTAAFITLEAVSGKTNTYYIKRIIGLPGETVQIADGTIYINGEVLEESYGREVMQDPGIAAEPITLGEDEYFVLGDNRNQSSDSRDPSVGLIHRDEIIGRAWLRIWPLNSFGILKHQ